MLCERRGLSLCAKNCKGQGCVYDEYPFWTSLPGAPLVLCRITKMDKSRLSLHVFTYKWFLETMQLHTNLRSALMQRIIR